MIKRRINLSEWINNSTHTSNTVIELGAGFFDRLSCVNESVITKVGIEIYEPYIKNPRYN